MTETEAHIAIVTESWLKDGIDLENLREELREASGTGLLCKNRPTNDIGVAYGGVSILWREGNVSFKEIPLKNPGSYEVLAAAGTIPGQRRKLVVVGCYIPPNYVKTRGEATLTFIVDTVIELKRKYHDPQLIVAGDFNQWEIGQALEDFADIKEVDIGPTRGSRSIDRIFLNMSRAVSDSGTLEPCLLYTSPSPRDRQKSRMPSSA